MVTAPPPESQAGLSAHSNPSEIWNTRYCKDNLSWLYWKSLLSIGLGLPASSFSMTKSMHWLFQSNYLHVYLWCPALWKLIRQMNTELQVSNGRWDTTFTMPRSSSPKFFTTFTTVAQCEPLPLCWTSFVLCLSIMPESCSIGCKVQTGENVRLFWLAFISTILI